jgi:trimeric autotransporter adhesin
MQKNSNRKGLALGAAFAMVASLFVGVAPASANTDGQYIAVTPAAGTVTNFNGILAEDFPLTSYLLPNSANASWTSSTPVMYEITKTAGNMNVLVAATSESFEIQSNATPTTIGAASSVSIEASSSKAVTLSGLVSASNGVSYLTVRAYSTSGILSSSPSVTLTIKTWVENPATTNGIHDSLEWFTTRTVVLHGINAVPARASVGSPKVGDTVLTVSGSVDALNFRNLDGRFYLVVESTNNQLLGGAATESADLDGTTMALRAGVVSQSFAVSGSGLIAGTSVSAHVRYSSDSAAVLAASGFRLGALGPVVIAGTKTAALTLDVVEGDNASQTGTTATVRANQTYTFRVGATSASASVSGAVLSAKLTAGTGTLGLNVKEISVNGAAATTSYPAALALTTGTDGFATFTIGTTGFVNNDGFSITVADGNVSKSLTVVVAATTDVLSADDSLLSAAVGATAPVHFSVDDQWDVASTRTDLRLKITKGQYTTGFSYTDTVSYVAVAAGAAKFDFTPTPATLTGSAKVTAQLQEFQRSTNTYIDLGSPVDVKVTVTAIADAHSVGPVVSQSASVSYFPSTVSWKTITGSVKNAGALIEVTGPAALVFRVSSADDDTSSAKLELRADEDGEYSFEVASLLIKSHTVTIKTGTAVTTSLLVVDPVTGSMGVKVAFDKTTITAGETSVITGTVTDANGNPVDTTNSGSTAVVVVSWTGKGLPFNTGSNIETDEDGKFKVNVLALAGDLGTGTITATYRPAGAAVDTKNVTATQVITIAAPAAVAAPEINAVIGSFNGRWAVRVENAKGAAVSVKVGGRWVKFTALNDNYLFSRKSTVGATVPVAVYVNGQLENVATITIK